MLHDRWRRNNVVRCLLLWICGTFFTGISIRRILSSDERISEIPPVYADLLNVPPEGDATITPKTRSVTDESSLRYKLLLEWQRSYRRNGLGNQLFLYASLIGIASRNKLQPIIPSFSPVINVFNLEITDLHIVEPEVYDQLISKGRALPRPEIYSSFCCVYFPFVENMKNHIESDVVLHGAFQSWKYFHPEYTERIKQSLKFRTEIITEADNIIQNLRTNLSGNTVLVGIHVRRGDILKTHLRQFGHVPAPESYFQRAQKYMDSRHRSVFYVVVTNDVPWAEKAISGPNVKVLEKVKPEVALALLAKMNHLITSTGTFSWWAGFMSNALDILYFSGAPTPLSFYDITFRLEDYYLPQWVGIS